MGMAPQMKEKLYTLSPIITATRPIKSCCTAAADILLLSVRPAIPPATPPVIIATRKHGIEGGDLSGYTLIYVVSSVGCQLAVLFITRLENGSLFGIQLVGLFGEEIFQRCESIFSHEIIHNLFGIRFFGI